MNDPVVSKLVILYMSSAHELQVTNSMALYAFGERVFGDFLRCLRVMAFLALVSITKAIIWDTSNLTHAVMMLPFRNSWRRLFSSNWMDANLRSEMNFWMSSATFFELISRAEVFSVTDLNTTFLKSPWKMYVWDLCYISIFVNNKTHFFTFYDPFFDIVLNFLNHKLIWLGVSFFKELALISCAMNIHCN